MFLTFKIDHFQLWFLYLRISAAAVNGVKIGRTKEFSSYKNEDISSTLSIIYTRLITKVETVKTTENSENVTIAWLE